MTLALWSNTARLFSPTIVFLFVIVIAVVVVNYKHALMHVSEPQEMFDRYPAAELKSQTPSAGSPFSRPTSGLALG
jgi:hypothetical protein